MAQGQPRRQTLLAATVPRAREDLQGAAAGMPTAKSLQGANAFLVGARELHCSAADGTV